MANGKRAGIGSAEDRVDEAGAALDADELEGVWGEEDAADSAEGEEVIPGLPHGLLPRQKIWAERWVRHWNGTLAAKEAGYKGDARQLSVRAARNKKNAKVQSYIALLLCPEAGKVDATYIKQQLLREALGASHSRDRIKGLELLGRSVGMIKDYHEHHFDRPTDQLLHSLAKTQPDLAAMLAPLLGVEWPPPEKAGAPPQPTAPGG